MFLLLYSSKGAVECLSHTTSIDDPFYYYDAIRDQEHKRYYFAYNVHVTCLTHIKC